MVLRRILRALWNNIGTLLLAFALAFAVWISAVVAADPNDERNYPNTVPLEVRGQDPGMTLLGELPSAVTVRLSAPSSLWDQLSSEPGVVTAYVDVSDLEDGQHTLPIEVDVSLGPVRVVSVSPETVTVEIEPLAVETFPITPAITGEPALGFSVDDLGLVLEPGTVSVSGPRSLVADVVEVRIAFSVDGARETVIGESTPQAVDAEGNVLSGLKIEPLVVGYSQPLIQEGGYREVAVVVETIGLQANGFRVTNITVSPPIITLFSSDPSVVAELPGFVSTLPLDINGANDDIEARLALDLPDGVIVVGEEQNVFVVIGIAPIETSIVLEIQVETIGLSSNLQAALSPDEVSVILSGPLAVLDNLQPGDVRLLVDLSGLGVGSHLVEPEAEILPDGVEVLSVTPSSIEVIITRR